MLCNNFQNNIIYDYWLIGTTSPPSPRFFVYNYAFYGGMIASQIYAIWNCGDVFAKWHHSCARSAVERSSVHCAVTAVLRHLAPNTSRNSRWRLRSGRAAVNKKTTNWSYLQWKSRSESWYITQIGHPAPHAHSHSYLCFIHVFTQLGGWWAAPQVAIEWN